MHIAPLDDREIVMTRVLHAPRGHIFDAWTKPELLKRWLLGPPGWSMIQCDVDLKVGGGFRFVWRNRDGTKFGMRGVYHEIVRPERLVHTEVFDEDWTGGETLVTTILTEQNSGTGLKSTVRYSSRQARDKVLDSGMEQGVRASYDRLDELLAVSEEREDRE